MKKSIAAAFALAAPFAQAQSSVSLSGMVDLYVAHARSGKTSVSKLDEGGGGASRFVLRGREDLGGGLEARFLLEAGFAPDTGLGTLPGPAISFSRQSFVGLAGRWGQLDAGRMYTPMFYTLFRADPFGINSVFSPLNLIAATDAQPGMTPFTARASNMVRYRTPANSEFFADIAYAPGEAASLSRSSGKMYGGAIGWGRKPYYIAYAFQKNRAGSAAAPQASPAASTFHALSGSYEFSALRLYANYVSTASSLASVPRARLVSLGAQYPVTPASNLIVEAMQRKVHGSERSQLGWTLGYDHFLSKRTAVYARWLRLNNRHGASASLAGVAVAPNSGDDVRVIAAGIRHSF
ncbi:porin [Xenophilus arseniciresistens]|uniref:Porin n=1 Tax=Xenophilus arseniciresistens TaxID=1283306 RepID=A0AAE3N9N5_9BURK|nr:porin [Xenophilus arseniciresistens]MDA7416861.1 porin [Xenophilus arseniciresistens]